MEGSDVTLRCKAKTTPSNLTADFYKDGVFIRSSSTGETTIHSISKSDEGFYKCSISDSGESPESWLAVRGGSVILESPVLPVMEGSDVTLRCKTKTTPSNLTADFYKDGFHFGNGSTGETTIHSVSKSDEGFYTCRISGFEESPKSWLDVKETTTVHTSTSEPGGGSIRTEQAFDTDVQSSPSQFTLVCVSIVLAVLVLVVALLHCGKHRVAVCFSSQTRTPKSDSGEDTQTDSGEASVATPTKATYGIVKKHITKKDENDPAYYTLCPAKSGASSDSAGMSPSAGTCALLEDRFYSTIQQVAEGETAN
ncbi:Fc receptor-like protein 6 [Myripristis murdjan]|uniref:Fc receptor-like protein 6 n=1 Tax=Myripristis murdjan TaxID=586833 RepID=UPI001175CB2B|nr:Fc receptor-like protein 6 [Myripristis murdjan]